jgi:tetratricopeptide (TPR) repeat protein
LAHASQCHGAGRLAEAEQGYRQVLQSNPEHPDALHLLGVLIGQSNDVQTGINLINKALQLQPEFPEALFNLGLILQNNGLIYEAALSYTRVIRLDPKRAQAWNNLAICFSDLGQIDDALSTIVEGIAQNPASENLYDNGCRFHKRQDDFLACIDLADRGIRHLPESSRLWIHKAHAYFALGWFGEAWDAYSWRKRAPENPNKDPSYPVPVWQGENLTDKSILIWTEQGPGETFLFSSLVDDIAELTTACTIATTERLKPILARSFPSVTVVNGETYHATPETTDFQCSLMDLGRWMRRSSGDFEARPSSIKADVTRMQKRAENNSLENDEFLKVGIAWRSLNIPTAAEKSLTLDSMRAILAVPGIKFVSLQYGTVEKEIETLRSATGLSVDYESSVDPIADLDGHLAQIASLDLVISTSNTAAHAAGALGVPTWVLLHHTIGEGLYWPWLTERTDCPWYRSAILYRQPKRGDWATPIAKVAIDLARFKAQKTPEFALGDHLAALAFAYFKSKQGPQAGLAAMAALETGQKDLNLSRLAAKHYSGVGEPESALETLNTAALKGAESADFLIDRANVLKSTGRLDEAIEDLERALAITPHQIAALDSLAKARRENGQLQLGLDALLKAHALEPDMAGIRMSLGTFLSEIGKLDESRQVFSELIKEQKSVADAASSLSMALLIDKQFNEGWPLLRHRFGRAGANIVYAHFPFPVWNGESLNGKHILVWTEQGIGEEILTATLLQDLAKTAKAITLLCSKRMVPVLKRSLKGVRVVERKQPLPAEALDRGIDIQMSLGDLGQLLRPSVQSFGSNSGSPTLQPNSQKRKKLRRNYEEQASGNPLVGLSWYSGAPEVGRLKSLSPDLTASLIKGTEAQYISLQYSPSAEDLATLSEAGADRWINDTSVDPLVDMELATAQVAAMDFVVTISNTTAHIAGGLGIPTALLVPKHTGRFWYWFKDQPASLWYPSVQIYESDDAFDWTHALTEIVERIRSLSDVK